MDKWELWKGWKKGSRHTQYGKGFGKQNEVSDWSQDVWDLNGIHALTTVPSQAEFTHYSFTKPRSIAVAPCQPVTVRNRFEVLSLGDEAWESRESEFGEKESRDTLQDGACFESVFPHVQNKALKTKLARKKDSPPRGKFTNRFKQSLQDFVQTETVNGWGKNLISQLRSIRSHSWVTWSRQTRVFIRCKTLEGIAGNLYRVSWILEQSTVLRLLMCLPCPLTEWQGSVNGMQYHTADGTRSRILVRRPSMPCRSKGPHCPKRFRSQTSLGR